MSSRSRTRTVLSVLLTVLLLLVALPAAAAPGGNGPGGGGGSGGGGSGGGGSGGGSGGGGSGGDYSELLLLYRDVDGVPITTDEFVGEHGSEYCVQPVTSSREVPNPYYLLEGEAPQYLPTVENPVDGREVTLVPLFAHYPEFLPEEEEGDDPHGHTTDLEIAEAPDGRGPPEDHDDEGGEPCDPLVITLPEGNVNYADFASEVELERLNLARSPANVLLQHMKEVEAYVETTDPALFTLDTSGRPVFDGVGIDAGPKLQGIREALLEKGTIPGADSWSAYPFPFRLVARFGAGPTDVVVRDFDQWTNWDLSAFALGGAASKFTPISLDVVPYHDRIMGIPGDWAASDGWPKLVHYSEELGEYFVDYSGFSYERAATYPGCATYLDPVTIEWVVMPYLEAQYPIGDLWVDVFEPLPPNAVNGVLGNVAGYAQMAEDARSMNYFTHMFSELYLPVADPVGIDTCAAQRAALGDPGGPGGDPGDPVIDPVVGSVTLLHAWDLTTAGGLVTEESLEVTFEVDIHGSHATGGRHGMRYGDLAEGASVVITAAEVTGLPATCTAVTDLTSATFTVTEAMPDGEISVTTVVTCTLPDPDEDVRLSGVENAITRGKGKVNGNAGAALEKVIAKQTIR
jgi:hypothetical protein